MEHPASVSVEALDGLDGQLLQVRVSVASQGLPSTEPVRVLPVEHRHRIREIERQHLDDSRRELAVGEPVESRDGGLLIQANVGLRCGLLRGQLCEWIRRIQSLQNTPYVLANDARPRFPTALVLMA